MIRALQAVGWSLLAPEPIHFASDGVVAMIGRNGSGKSSALDALKSVLGARRFGQGRTASSYRFAGRAGAPAARNAYLLCVMANQRPGGTRRLDGYGEEITVVMEAGPTQRRFLLLDGRRLLPTGPELPEALAALRAEHPRSAWLKPSDYERRVLLALGFGSAVRRLLEIPQGEVQRALDRDPQALVGLLVELAGGRDAAEAFGRAQGALEEARGAHAEARRRVDRRRAELAERRLRLEHDARAARLRRRLSALRPALAAALSDLEDHQDARRVWVAERDRKVREHRAAQARRSAEARRASAPAPAPPEPEVVAEPRRLSVIDVAALRAHGIRIVTRDGMLCVHADDRDKAQELLGPGQALLVAVDGLRLTLASDAIISGPKLRSARRAADTPPALAAAAPDAALFEAPDPLPEPQLEPEVEPVDERLVARLRAALGDLADAGIGDGERDDELPADPEALLGMLRAYTADGIPPAPRNNDSAEELAQAEAMLNAETAELDTRAAATTEAQQQLAEARAAYEQAVARALEGAAARFGELCRDAGMDGRMTVGEGPDGPQVLISAAESPGEELRPLWGAKASLSGGWRATVVVLALLACLDAEQALPALLLDEVGASLDETRLAALGTAFARLAERRGLQTVMTLPTNTMSDVVAEFAVQQIGFMRPVAGEPLAPPPHIVSLRDRALRAA